MFSERNWESGEEEWRVILPRGDRKSSLFSPEGAVKATWLGGFLLRIRAAPEG